MAHDHPGHDTVGADHSKTDATSADLKRRTPLL
jgi:hypothetical protein